MSGDLDNILIKNGFINGENATNARGIANPSGVNLFKVKVRNTNIKKVNVGISFNAHLGGSVSNCSARYNHLSDILGTEPGSGYGIHIANAHHNDILFNTIERAQRHSIYHARGSFNRIMFNKIIDHRKGVANNSYRPAIAVYRDSINVDVRFNNILRASDGAIHVYTDDEDFESDYEDLQNVNVENNDISYPQNNIPSIIAGGLGTSYRYKMRHVNIQENKLLIDVTEIKWAYAAIIQRGFDGTFIDNNIIYKGVNQRINAVVIKSDKDDMLDNLSISGNIFDVGGPDTREFRCFIADGTILTDNSRITSEDNVFRNYKTSVGIRYVRYDRTNKLTNNNLKLLDMLDNNQRMSEPPKSNFYQKGEMIYNSNPALNSFLGWVCVQDGNPGIWKPFGKITE